MQIEGLQIVTLGDVADELHCHPAAIWQAVRRLQIPSLRIGGGRAIERKHIAAIANEVARHLVVTRKLVQ